MANTIKSSTRIHQILSVNRTSNSDIGVEKAISAKTTDEVQISRTLESIQSLSKALAEGEPVDHARVDKIRSAIKSGEYTIDTDRIARKFLELEKQLEK